MMDTGGDVLVLPLQEALYKANELRSRGVNADAVAYPVPYSVGIDPPDSKYAISTPLGFWRVGD